MLTSDQDMVVASVEPPIDNAPAFTSEPAILRDFLKYLSTHSFVRLKMVAHSIQRNASSMAGGAVTWTVAPSPGACIVMRVEPIAKFGAPTWNNAWGWQSLNAIKKQEHLRMIPKIT